MINSMPTVKAAHRKAADAVLDTIDGPFRRSALSQALYAQTVPRSRDVADRLADKLLRELANSGRIQRHGHQHWTKVVTQRKLRSDRLVPELPKTVDLVLTTRCPAKWLSVDMETGDVWAGSQSGWRRATAAERNEAIAGLSNGPSRK